MGLYCVAGDTGHFTCRYLAANQTAYGEYFDWKRSGKIKASFARALFRFGGMACYHLDSNSLADNHTLTTAVWCLCGWLHYCAGERTMRHAESVNSSMSLTVGRVLVLLRIHFAWILVN